MTQCKHRLGFMQNIFASRTIRFKCLTCEHPVYREHHLVLGFLGPSLPIWIFALIGAAFVSEILFWSAMLLVVFSMGGAYLIDLKQYSLEVYSAEESKKDSARAKKSLLLVLGIIILGAIFESTR
jgi:hypothetical protein